MKRLLITGGSSYVGQHLVPLAARDYNLQYTYFQNDPLSLPQGVKLDVRDSNAVNRVLSDWQPQAVIHLAGSNRNPDMERVIRLGAENVTAACLQYHCRLIHLSTDVVFDGRGGPYVEEDLPNPMHAYGQAKAYSEAIVRRLDNHVIIRTSLIYGLDEIDRSTEWIASALEKGESVTLFEDQIRNPVWVETLSLSCLELVGSPFTGVLHVAGNQSMSRAEFGLKLLDWWGINQRDLISIGPSSDEWPKDCRLDTRLAGEILEAPMVGFDQVVKSASSLKEGDSPGLG